MDFLAFLLLREFKKIYFTFLFLLDDDGDYLGIAILNLVTVSIFLMSSWIYNNLWGTGYTWHDP